MNEISDRHLRPVSGVAPGQEAASLRLRIRIGDAWARTPAGQLTFTCLVNLLCRQTDLVRSIDLAGPPALLTISVPHDGGENDLLASAAKLVHWAVGDAVAVSRNAADQPVDICIVVGAGAPDDLAGTTLAAIGDGWRAWAGQAMDLPPVCPCSANPLGPFLAACLVSGEVFKRARGITRGRYVDAIGYSIWSGDVSEGWADLSDGPELEARDLPPFYLVGAGAVGQALAYVIGSSHFRSGHIAVLDDDVHDTTNLNRCFLAGLDDDEDPKILVVESFLRRNGIAVHARQEVIGRYVERGGRGTPEPFADQEAEGVFDVVVSCVDKGTSRQDVQGLWPRLVLGGSTMGLTAKAIVYDLKLGTACLGCHNPAERDGDRLRELERQVRQMSIEEKHAFLSGKVENLADVMAYLDERTCGSVGERQFRALAVDDRREFSVSFLSLAAGVLLGGRLFSEILFHGLAPRRPMMTSLAFLNGAAEDAALSIDCACPRCSSAARQRFARAWPAS